MIVKTQDDVPQWRVYLTDVTLDTLREFCRASRLSIDRDHGKLEAQSEKKMRKPYAVISIGDELIPVKDPSERADVEDLRLECLKLAAEMEDGVALTLKTAQKMADFVMGKKPSDE